MIGHTERDHIRNIHSIVSDAYSIMQASLRKSDCTMIDDKSGMARAREDELHRAFVLYAHVVDYLEDCNVIDRDTRNELVTQFSDILDGYTFPAHKVDNTK